MVSENENSSQLKVNGTTHTPSGSNGKTQAVSDTSQVPEPTGVHHKPMSTPDVAAKDSESTTLPATVGVSQAAIGQVPMTRISSALPKCLSDLRSDLESLWYVRVIKRGSATVNLTFPSSTHRLKNQPRIISEFGILQRAALMVQNERDTFQQQLNIAQESAGTTKAELDAAKSTIAGLEKTLQAHIEDAKRTDNLVNAQTSELTAKKMELSANKAELERIRKELNDVRAHVTQLTSKIGATQEQVHTFEKERDALRVQLSQKTTEEQATRTKVGALETEKQQLQTALADLQGKNQILVQSNQQFVRERMQNRNESDQRAENDKVRHEADIKTFQTINDDLHKEIKETQERAEQEVKAERERISSLSAANAKLQHEVNLAKTALSNKIEALSQVKADHAKVVQEAEAKLVSLQSQLSQARSTDTHELQKWKKSADIATRQRDEKLLEINKLQTENSRLADEIAQARASYTKLDEQIRSTNNRVNELTKQNERYIRENETLRKDGVAKNKTQEALKIEIGTLQKRIDAVASENRELEGENESLQVEISLRGKAAASEVDMETAGKRIRAEEEQKLAAALLKLRTEKDAEAERLANEITKLEAQNAQLISASKVLGKRSRHEPQTEEDWRKYAEDRGKTFFDPEGVCIACR